MNEPILLMIGTHIHHFLRYTKNLGIFERAHFDEPCFSLDETNFSLDDTSFSLEETSFSLDETSFSLDETVLFL